MRQLADLSAINPSTSGGYPAILADVEEVKSSSPIPGARPCASATCSLVTRDRQVAEAAQRLRMTPDGCGSHPVVCG
jgi:hypothetical protein